MPNRNNSEDVFKVFQGAPPTLPHPKRPQSYDAAVQGHLQQQQLMMGPGGFPGGDLGGPGPARAAWGTPGEYARALKLPPLEVRLGTEFASCFKPAC